VGVREYNQIVNMENNIAKQSYMAVNVCIKNRSFILATIFGKYNRRGF
jgi:hypothetical protein